MNKNKNGKIPSPKFEIRINKPKKKYQTHILNKKILIECATV